MQENNDESRILDRDLAGRDLAFVADVVRRTHARIDPHLFHFVHWGLIVLAWYPLSNWFAATGRERWLLPLGIGSFALGMVLSCVREFLLARKPRLSAENTFVSLQVALVTAGSIVAGIVLSALAPALGFIAGENMPILWGLVYANLAFMTGVIYSRDFLWAGGAIFTGVVLAIVFQDYNGYILGAFMGLGMVVPGLRAEARVRALIREQDA